MRPWLAEARSAKAGACLGEARRRVPETRHAVGRAHDFGRNSGAGIPFDTISLKVMLISSALALGFLHGLGADHLMAIAALSTGAVSDGAPAGSRRARALGVAVRFAIGHALLLGVGTSLLVVLGWSLPLVVERGGEILGGMLLILMGGVSLWGVAAGRVYGHTHTHDGEAIPHWHLHIGRRERHPRAAAHSHLPTIVGAAFAVSSLRALTLLAPTLTRAAVPMPLPSLLSLIGLFAVGILLSMSLFGVAFARVMSVRAVGRLGSAAAVVMALASVTLGVFWIASA
jgi:nickel/cobalt transporter (NicO) family protein